MRSNEEQSREQDSPLVVLIWLVVQLVALVLMLALYIFHFVRIHPASSCAAVANLSAENDANYTTISEGPFWELSAVSVSFILVSLIITIVDAAFNMHDLIHQVLDRGDAGAERECKLESAKQPPCLCPACPFLPAGLLRVYYCWTLIHIILITVAANTNKWAWQTDDDIDVLSHTAVFFLTCISYLLLVVAIFTRYGCIWIKHKPPRDQLKFSIILTTVLVFSHITCTSATLVVLFSNEPDLDCLSRIVVGLPVAVYVILKSSLWLLLNYCLAKQENAIRRTRDAAGITKCITLSLSLLVAFASVGALIACVTIVQLSMNPLKRLSLLLYSLTIILWLILLFFLMRTTSTRGLSRSDHHEMMPL